MRNRSRRVRRVGVRWLGVRRLAVAVLLGALAAGVSACDNQAPMLQPVAPVPSITGSG